MNDLAMFDDLPDTVAPTARPASQALTAVLAAVTNPHPDIGAPRSFPAHVHDEALARLSQLRDQAKPATAREWGAFLAPLMGIAANTPPREAIPAYCRALEFAMPSMPASVLTEDRSREALRRFTFWPKPAELAAWLEPEARAIHAEVSALRQIVAKAPTQPKPSDPAPMSVDQRDAWQARWMQMRAALQAGTREAEERLAPVRHNLRPGHLTGETLRQARIASGRYPDLSPARPTRAGAE